MKQIFIILLLQSIFIASAYSYCEYLGVCAKANQRCDWAYYNYSSHDLKVECETGYFCNIYKSEPICEKAIEEGGICDFSDCVKPLMCGFDDVKGHSYCRQERYLAHGENCEFDYQCDEKKCVEGKCGNPGNSCTNDRDCSAGFYCSDTECAPLLGTDQLCEDDENCIYDHICTYLAPSSTALSCQPQFNKKENEYCSFENTDNRILYGTSTRRECELGLECRSHKCSKPLPTLNYGDSCDSYNDCQVSANCQCPNDKSSDVNGTCTKPYELNNSKCQNAILNLYRCATKNNCKLFGNSDKTNMDSCIMKYCGDEYCSTDCYDFNAIQTCGENVDLSVCYLYNSNSISSSSITLPSIILTLFSIILLYI